MTPAQFALAVGAAPKWIANTRRLLNRAPRDTAEEARWLGLVHELNTVLGLPLKAAARCADLALAADPQQHHLTIDFGDEHRAALVIDLWRDVTLHLARLSRALEMPPSERRGRPVS